MSKTLNKVEKAVAESEMGKREPNFIFRSSTRVDTGRWWRRSPLCLLIYEDELVVLAASRRRYICRLSPEDYEQSYYSNRSGELILLPAENCQFKHIRMNPSDALQVFSELKF